MPLTAQAKFKVKIPESGSSSAYVSNSCYANNILSRLVQAFLPSRLSGTFINSEHPLPFSHHSITSKSHHTTIKNASPISWSRRSTKQARRSTLPPISRPIATTRRPTAKCIKRRSPTSAASSSGSSSAVPRSRAFRPDGQYRCVSSFPLCHLRHHKANTNITS
jgi:hypothetical protein